MKITALQIRIIHTLLNKKGLLEEKQELIKEFSKGKKTSTKELSYSEARLLISFLNQGTKNNEEDKKDHLRKTLISRAYTIGENIEFIKSWCKKYGVKGQKKNFNDYTKTELYQLLQKFDKVIAHRIKGVINNNF